MPEPRLQRFGFSALQFRILARDVRVPVMGQMKGAKPVEGKDQHNANGMPDPITYPI